MLQSRVRLDCYYSVDTRLRTAEQFIAPFWNWSAWSFTNSSSSPTLNFFKSFTVEMFVSDGVIKFNFKLWKSYLGFIPRQRAEKPCVRSYLSIDNLAGLHLQSLAYATDLLVMQRASQGYNNCKYKLRQYLPFVFRLALRWFFSHPCGF